MLLNTLNSHLIYSLGNILNVEVKLIQTYVSTYKYKLKSVDLDKIDIQHLIKYLSTFENKNVILPTSPIDVTIFHLTTRMNKDNIYKESLYNLHDALINPSEISDLFRKSKISFHKENQKIKVQYKGQEINWRNYDSNVARLIINRLEGNHSYSKDSTVNGFLFPDKIHKNNNIEHLISGPEIVQNIFEVLNKSDDLQAYQKKITPYIIGFKVPSSFLIFDNKTKLEFPINEYLLKFCLKKLADEIIHSDNFNDNPMVRFQDELNIPNSNILYVYEIDLSTDLYKLI